MDGLLPYDAYSPAITSRGYFPDLASRPLEAVAQSDPQGVLRLYERYLAWQEDGSDPLF